MSYTVTARSLNPILNQLSKNWLQLTFTRFSYSYLLILLFLLLFFISLCFYFCRLRISARLSALSLKYIHSHQHINTTICHHATYFQWWGLEKLGKRNRGRQMVRNNSRKRGDLNGDNFHIKREEWKWRGGKGEKRIVHTWSIFSILRCYDNL